MRNPPYQDSIPASNKTSNKKLPAARNRNSKGIRILTSMSAESNILRCFSSIMSQHTISVDYVFCCCYGYPRISFLLFLCWCCVSKEYSEYILRECYLICFISSSYMSCAHISFSIQFSLHSAFHRSEYV